MVARNSLKIIDKKALTLPPEAEEESEPAATAYLRLPPALKSRIEAAVARDKLSLNAWAIRCFESCCDLDKSVKVANQVAKVKFDLTRR